MVDFHQFRSFLYYVHELCRSRFCFMNKILILFNVKYDRWHILKIKDLSFKSKNILNLYDSICIMLQIDSQSFITYSFAITHGVVCPTNHLFRKSEKIRREVVSVGWTHVTICLDSESRCTYSTLIKTENLIYRSNKS